MKCQCPACGRSTEVDAAALDFFARCTRCGVLLKPRIQSTVEGDDTSESLIAKIVPVGRVREGHAANGQIADLLSRPSPARAIVAAAKVPAIEEPRLYELAPIAVAMPAPVPRPISEVLGVVPATVRRRVALRERHQTLGMVGIFGLGMIALMAVGAIALKSRDFFMRTAQAHPQSDEVRVGDGR